MTEIKFHDFIELDYTAKTKDENIIYDTTYQSIAKASGLESQNGKYEPIVICVGEKNLVPGLDTNIVGKEVDKEYTFEFSPEEAFGKKDAKLIQLIPSSRFRKDKMNPVPGMQVNVDNSIGIIKTVSGGRTLVDFNHPLSGKSVIYTIKVKRILDNEEEKIKNLLRMQMGIAEPHIHVNDGNVEVTFGKSPLPKEIVDILEGKVKNIIPEVKSLKFVPAENHVHTDSVNKTEKTQVETNDNHEGHNHAGHEHHNH